MDTALHRVFDKIKRDGNGCWVWQSADVRGYGALSFKGKTVYAHRLLFEVFVRKLREGEIVRHMCHNKVCCNPAHLKGGTHHDNCLDAREPPVYPREGQELAKLLP